MGRSLSTTMGWVGPHAQWHLWPYLSGHPCRCPVHLYCSYLGHYDMDMLDNWNTNSSRCSHSVAGYCSRSAWPLSAGCSNVPVPTNYSLSWDILECSIIIYQQRILKEDNCQPERTHCGVLVNRDMTPLPWVSRVGKEINFSIAFFFVFPFLLLGIKPRASDITGKTPALKCISSLEMYAWIYAWTLFLGEHKSDT